MTRKPAVRACRRADLAQVQEIYALEVREGTASFELEPPSLAEMIARFAAIEAAGLPYVVAELDGRVAGYAYAGPYRTRPGYQHTVEDSVYVARWARRQGVGCVLLDAVIERATARRLRQMVAIIGDFHARGLDPAACPGWVSPGRHARARGLEVRALARHRDHAAPARSRGGDAAGLDNCARLVGGRAVAEPLLPRLAAAMATREVGGSRAAAVATFRGSYAAPAIPRPVRASRAGGPAAGAAARPP